MESPRPSFEIAPPTPGESVIADAVKRRLDAKLNAIVVFYGPSGSGKSWSCLRIAELVYPKFTTELIVFSIDEYLALLTREGGIPRGAVVIWEESGIGASAREFMSKVNKIFSMVLESVRFRNHALFLNLPALRQLDINARRMSHFAVETMGVNLRGECATKFFIVRNVAWSDEPFLEYPRIKRVGQSTARIERVHIGRPNPVLSREYEGKRARIMAGTYENFAEEIWAEREKSRQKMDALKRRPGRPMKVPGKARNVSQKSEPPESG